MAIIRGESIEAYHANPALSKSKIMDFIKRGPAYYKAVWIDRKEQRKETKALRLGRIFDGLTDNMEREMERWAPEIPENAPKRPDKRQRNAKNPSPETVAAINFWDEWDAANVGKETVTADERTLLGQMLGAFRANPLVARMWDRCERQVTIRAELPELGVSLQSRPDGLILGNKPEMADVKSCRGLDHFDRDFFSFGYHVQASIGQWLLALEGIDVSASTVFPVVESMKYPRCEVFAPPEGALLHGWNIAKRAIEEIARRTSDNDWREVPQDTVRQIAVPRWQEIAMAEDDE